jgi:predicted ABC-type ATPase
MSRFIVVVAGPNGAGKTTFVQRFLAPLGLRIVNVEAIAAALNPPNPDAVAYEAAKAADVVREDLLARGVSFCMETVFSDREGSKIRFLRKARERAYAIVLIFVGLENSDLAIGRVIERTEHGGHEVDHAFVLDNSSAEEPYRLVAELRSGRVMRRGPHQPRWWTERE